MHRLALESIRLTAILAASLFATTPTLDAQVATGSVTSNLRLTEDAGGFVGCLEKEDRFATSVASLGSINADGTPDIAVGSRGDDDGGSNAGAVWILRLNTSGGVVGTTEINDASVGGALDAADEFGMSVAGLGDRDGDGVGDLAAGASGDDDGGSGRGAVYLIDLTSTGGVKSTAKSSSTSGGLGGVADGDAFGASLASLGDVDGDGVTDLAVGATGDDTGGNALGAVHILYLNANGTVKGSTKIAHGSGGLSLADSDQFGCAVALLGDVDGDGVDDLAVGAKGDDDGGSGRGAAYILFMNADETVKGIQKISDLAGNFTGTLDNSDQFGHALAGMEDLDNNGVPDLAVGAPGDDDGGSSKGAVYALFLNADGTVHSHRKYSDTAGGFTGAIEVGDEFGYAVACLDMNSDGVSDMAVGADLDDFCNDNYGAVWALRLNAEPNAWVDLGGASAGAVGTPVLTVNGNLMGDSSLNIALTNAPASSFCLAWIATSSTPVSALGGTLHANPFNTEFLFLTDPSGERSVSATWPTGVPANANVYLQFLIQDGSTADGIILSNGMQGTTP
jgi:hypothetical protein